MIRSKICSCTFMEELDIPIFRKSYELYKSFHGLRSIVPKADRHTLWQRCENLLLDVISGLIMAGQLPKNEKLPHLTEGSAKLNLLRMLLRLTQETKVLDLKKSTHLQQMVDEIGRMLGGWIKSVKDNPPPPRE